MRGRFLLQVSERPSRAALRQRRAAALATPPRFYAPAQPRGSRWLFLLVPLLIAGIVVAALFIEGARERSAARAERVAAAAQCRSLIAAALARGAYGREEMTRLIETCRRVA
jgi:hypothetical protein